MKLGISLIYLIVVGVLGYVGWYLIGVAINDPYVNWLGLMFVGGIVCLIVGLIAVFTLFAYNVLRSSN